MTSTSIISRRLALLPLLSALLLPQACTVLGPDYQTPPAQALPSTWQASEVTDTSTTNASWWQQFNDPVLDELVDTGARQNLSLEAAGLRIVQARAALGISDALIYPQLQNASGNLTRAYRNEQSLNSAGVSLDVGWEMDIWGKYARGIESAEAGLYATIASYRDVLVAITSEIARNYINYRTSQERIYLSQQNIAIQQRVVEMTQVQFDSGNVSELDVQQAKTQLYATQSTLPALRSSMAQSANAIAVLLGTLPENIEPLLALDAENYSRSIDDRMAPVDLTPQAHENFRAQYDKQSLIPVSPMISTTIDAQRVSARPDLQVAELQARAQNARIGARQADLYPQFFLAGSIGLSDTVPSGGSFSASNAVSAAVGPGFSWNIFQYDRIKNQVRIEDARFQEALVNYNQQVLDAVREVSNALVAYQYSREQADYNLAAVESSIRAFNISATQYDAGLVTYQRLLSTVEKMTLREDNYAQNRGNIAKNIVDLYKAVGGGWESYETQPRIRPETLETMKARTDWDDYLDAGKIMGEDRSSADDTE